MDTGSIEDGADVILVHTTAGKEDDAACCYLLEFCKKSYTFYSLWLLTRCKDAVATQGDDVFQGFLRVGCAVEGTMEGNAHRFLFITAFRQFYESAYNKGAPNQQGFLGGPAGNQDRQAWAQMMERGLGTGAFELPGSYGQTRRENIDTWAWGTPRGPSAVGSGRVGAPQQRDAFGRVIDAKTGRPLYGYGETGD